MRQLPQRGEHASSLNASKPGGNTLSEEPSRGEQIVHAGHDTLELVITLVHSCQAAALSEPSGVVMRAYGAYGLCADMSFNPDDLSLLDRCDGIRT